MDLVVGPYDRERECSQHKGSRGKSRRKSTPSDSAFGKVVDTDQGNTLLSKSHPLGCGGFIVIITIAELPVSGETLH